MMTNKYAKLVEELCEALPSRELDVKIFCCYSNIEYHPDMSPRFIPHHTSRLDASLYWENIVSVKYQQPYWLAVHQPADVPYGYISFGKTEAIARRIAALMEKAHHDD